MNNDQLNWEIIMYILNMDFSEAVEIYYKRKHNSS